MHIPLFATLATLAAAAPYAIGGRSPTSSLALQTPAVDGRSPCITPGQLLCQGHEEFALCTEELTVTWMAVSDGTSCVCSSPGSCAIVAANIVNNSPAPPTTPSPTSATLSATAPSTTAPAETTASSTPPATTTAAPTSSVAPSASPAAPSGSGPGYSYTQFNGNGSPQEGWPTMSDWLSFEDLFQANMPIGSGCISAFGVPDNSPNDTAALHDALLSEATAAGVPPEFALAITLQESLGCVFVDTSNNGVINPGLMQDHDGSATCYQQPTCPETTIAAMLKQGLNGTSSGAGIKQCYEQAPGNTPAQAWYQAARIYNAGSLGPDGSVGGPSAGTSCYVSDVANRLIGWSKGLGGCVS